MTQEFACLYLVSEGIVSLRRPAIDDSQKKRDGRHW